MTCSDQQLFFNRKTAPCTEGAGEQYGLVIAAYGTLFRVHGDRNQTLRPPEWLHFRIQAKQTLPEKRNILPPIEEFHTVDRKPQLLFIEKNSPSFGELMPSRFAVGTQFLLHVKQRFAAAHAERLFHIRKRICALPADQCIFRQKDSFADRAAGRIEHVKKNPAGLTHRV